MNKKISKRIRFERVMPSVLEYSLGTLVRDVMDSVMFAEGWTFKGKRRVRMHLSELENELSVFWDMWDVHMVADPLSPDLRFDRSWSETGADRDGEAFFRKIMKSCKD